MLVFVYPNLDLQCHWIYHKITNRFSGVAKLKGLLNGRVCKDKRKLVFMSAAGMITGVPIERFSALSTQ